MTELLVTLADCPGIVDLVDKSRKILCDVGEGFVCHRVDGFDLERLHEALRLGVIVRIAAPAHRADKTVAKQRLPIALRGVLGGFKWSSQHLDGSCDEHSKTALGSFWAGALVLTRSTAGGRARGAAAILGSDCGGHGE